jgi:hypothetical protein
MRRVSIVWPLLTLECASDRVWLKFRYQWVAGLARLVSFGALKIQRSEGRIWWSGLYEELEKVAVGPRSIVLSTADCRVHLATMRGSTVSEIEAVLAAHGLAPVRVRSNVLRSMRSTGPQ